MTNGSAFTSSSHEGVKGAVFDKISSMVMSLLDFLVNVICAEIWFTLFKQEPLTHGGTAYANGCVAKRVLSR